MESPPKLHIQHHHVPQVQSESVFVPGQYLMKELSPQPNLSIHTPLLYWSRPGFCTIFHVTASVTSDEWFEAFFFFQHYQFVTWARWQSMASTLGIYLDRGGFLGVMCREQWELCTQPCSKKIYVYETLDTTIAKSNAENQWWDRSFSMSSGIAGRQV